MLRATVEFLGQGAQSSLDGAARMRLRRMQVLVAVKLPMAGAMPTEGDLLRAAELRLSTFQSLGTIGLRPEALGSGHYVRLLSTMLNWGADAGWHDRISPECDPALLIRDSNRYRTVATRHAIPLLPVFADWPGTGMPTLNFVSRNGQMINVSLFDSGTRPQG